MQNTSKETLDDLDPTTQHILHQHAHEISIHSRTQLDSAPHIALKRKANNTHAVLHFLRHSVSKYAFSVITSPQTIIADPVGATFALLVLPMIQIALLFVQVVFLIAGAFGVDQVGNWFSYAYGGGLSAVNILDPSMFDDSTAKAIHQAARKGLNNAYGFPDASQMPDPTDETTPNRYFNLDIAKSLIILNALVYERDDTYVQAASKVAKRDDLDPTERQNRVVKNLLQSSRKIRNQATKWDMNFSSVSDFVSIGGPFCGLFWPKDASENWIVIAFKGTSPTNFSEFLVDATITHHNAHSFFGSGALHEGFYTSLAPGMESEVDPYANILHSLKHVAKTLRQNGGEKINLWITGHSLGAALSSLMYARLLFSPHDLGEDLILRQGYMYGTPRIADAEFISAFDFAASKPFNDTTRSMWRIVDRWDVVTHVPPGLADDEDNRAVLPSTSLLNYGHFGTAGIKLTGFGSGWKVQSGSFRGGSTLQIVQSAATSTEPARKEDLVKVKKMGVLGVQFDPIAALQWTASLVGPGSDHIPSNYYARLMKVKPSLVV